MNIELMQSRSFLERKKRKNLEGWSWLWLLKERQVNHSDIRISHDCRRAANSHVNEHLDV